MKSEGLLAEQARLIQRGVRLVSLIAEPLETDDENTNLAILRDASGTEVLSFAFSRHIAGFASHAWAVDLLRWALGVANPQRSRVIGLLLGYSGDAIESFEGENHMETFDPMRTCPQGCGSSVSNYYHGVPKDRIEEELKCKDFELPHMHRECAGCHYQWGETPVV